MTNSPPTAIMLEFGRRLRCLRNACEALEPGMHSQEQWAEACGVDAATIARWEKGFVGNHFDVFVGIALSTRVDMDYLFLGVLPTWTPDALRNLLRQRDPTLVSPAQFGASQVTLLHAATLRAARPALLHRRGRNNAATETPGAVPDPSTPPRPRR